MAVPAKEVWIHHSVTAPSHAGDIDVRRLQRIAFGRGFADISYSFVIHPSGEVYEGRGFGIVGAHTEGHNSISHGICFIGDFTNSLPTRSALDACRWLIAEGIRLGKFSAGVQPTGGHRDASGASTACPGTNLYKEISYLRQPYNGAPTQSAGGVVPGPITEDNVQGIKVPEVRVDANGDGYYDLPGLDNNKVVHVKPNGADPVVNGYQRIPSFATLGVNGSNTRIVIRGAVPNGIIAFTVWVTT